MVSTHSFAVNKTMLLWMAVGLWFASGFLPWVTVSFGGTGSLGVSVIDIYGLISAMSNPNAYAGSSNAAYAASVLASGIGILLIAGWTFSLIMMLVAALIRKKKLILTAAIFGILPSIIWIVALAPHTATPQQYSSGTPYMVIPEIDPGAGAGVGVFAGFVAVYSYFKGRHNNKQQPDVSKKSAI